MFRLAIEAARYVADPRLLPALVSLRPWWDVDSELLESAILLCDPEHQANEIAALGEFMTTFDEVTVDSHGRPSMQAYCPLFETNISVEVISASGMELGYDFDGLVKKRGNGDPRSVVSAILADLQQREIEGPPVMVN